jgi:hypothetical protein
MEAGAAENINAGLPALTSTRLGPPLGALMSYGSDYVALARQSAAYIDKILKGGQTGRVAGLLSHQVLVGDQSQDRTRSRPRSSAGPGSPAPTR